MGQGVFRHRRVGKPRRRIVFSAKGTTPEGGKGSFGVGGLASPTKTVGVAGTLTVGSGGVGQAVKTMAQDVLLAVGTGATSTDKKRSTQISVLSVGTGSSALHSRIALPKAITSGSVATDGIVHGPTAASIGVSGTVTGLTKNAFVTGITGVGTSGYGGYSKKVNSRGRAQLGVSSTGVAAKVADLEVADPFLPVTFALSPFRGSGSAGGGVGTEGNARRIASVRGVSGVGGAAIGNAHRRVPLRGTSGVGLAEWSLSKSKRSSNAGRSVVGLSGRANQIRVGHTIGTRVSNPLLLSIGPKALPITSSLIRWEDTIPPSGGTVKVETTVDNGGTWQECTNGGQIPRLKPGLIVSNVMNRITMTRPTGLSPSPRVHRIETRVGINSSRTELVQLGRFLINEVQIKDSPDGQTLEIAGADLSRKIDRNVWDRTVSIPAGTLTVEAIKMLARDRFPGVVLNFITTNDIVPNMFFGEQDQNSPWDDMTKLAIGIGCELFFDAFGILTLRKTPDPTTDDSQWEFTDISTPTMTDLNRRVSDDNTFNYIIVSGESTYNIAPVRGYALDDDPASPTYVLGPFGVNTLRIVSQSVTNISQAYEAAAAYLLKFKGATEQVDISAVTMAALETSDIVTITRGRSKVAGKFIADQIYMGLGATDLMTMTARRQRY
jgi:hypothetical protein